MNYARARTRNNQSIQATLTPAKSINESIYKTNKILGYGIIQRILKMLSERKVVLMFLS